MRLSIPVAIFTGGGVCGAGPDLCHELKEKMGYNHQMHKWIEKNAIKDVVERHGCHRNAVVEMPRMPSQKRKKNKRAAYVLYGRVEVVCLFAFANMHSYRVGCGCSFYRRPSECSACFDLFQE